MKKLWQHLTDNIIFRTVVVIATTIATTYFALTGSLLWATAFVLLLVGAIRWVVSLHQRQLKKVIFLLDALENNDNALRFSQQTGSTDNDMINRLLNRVTQILHETKVETIQQEKYYELILSSINTGVIVLNDTGGVMQKNNEVLRLLGLDIFTHIRQLQKVSITLMEKIESARSGDTFHIQFSNERGNINLSVRVSDITIHKAHLRIFALSDINNELDEKELDSWIRLIRVLTHEIMNSVTPITSLSDTLLSAAKEKDKELYQGLHTISTTGKGLLAFVESYRKFTRIPTPAPSLFYVKPFVSRMVELTKHQYPCPQITFDVCIHPEDLILYADENLISQVMINLLKNAIQAIGNTSGGLIRIHAYCDINEEVLIEVSNNGTPIPPEVAAQIFVPFFTTKSHGSGVGLSISRQIMRLSSGSISLSPTPSPTTFVLRFK